MPVMLWGLPRAERAGVGRLLGRPGPLRQLLRWLTHPVIAWWLFIVSQWLWHQPAAYELALREPWVHSAEHISFFVTAILFWWPVIGAAPLLTPLGYPARLLYTFLAWLPNSLLGAGIALSSGVMYPVYADRARAYGVDAFADQQLAGMIMWVPGDVLFLSILLLLFVAYMRHEERSAERIDRELDLRDAR
jgi:putative membrane protein